MDVAGRMEVIRELCSFEGRVAGTDAERRAANRMAERLRELGRRCEVEPTHVHPQYGLVHALHCALGFAGSLVAVAIPALGFALVLFAATSMYLDLNYRLYLLRRLFFRRASQNVVSRGGRADAPARLVLVAHLDAARAGGVFAPRRVRRAASLAAPLPFPVGPFRVVFWSLAALLPLLGLRMAGIESDLLAAAQLIPTFVLLVAAFLLVDIDLSPASPGANDNASGVATVISLAAELAAEAPQHLDIWIVLTGGEECLQEGMRAFVRAHRDDLDPTATYFVCIDTVGRGDVRFETTAGWVVSYEMSRRLAQLCHAIADADREGPNRFRAAALKRGTAGDAMPARLAGYEATTLTCVGEGGIVPDRHTADDLPESVDGAALEGAHGFARDLVRQLDRDVGRRRGSR